MRSDGVCLIAAIVFGGALWGCASERTVLEDSAVDIHGDYASELDYWDEVAQRRVVTNDDALYGLLLLAGADVYGDYEARLASGRERGWVASGASARKNESATVGMISMAVCDILGIQGGVTMRLLGPGPRYCTREVVYLELMPLRSEYQSLSGLEFIDLASRVEDVMVQENGFPEVVAPESPEEAGAVDEEAGDGQEEPEPGE